MSSDPSRGPDESREAAPENHPTADAGPTAAERASAVPARVRRAPRFGRFIWSGALLGVVLALVLTLAVPADSGRSRIAVVALAVGLALVGALVAAVVVVLADRRTR